MAPGLGNILIRPDLATLRPTISWLQALLFLPGHGLPLHAAELHRDVDALVHGAQMEAGQVGVAQPYFVCVLRMTSGG